MHRQARSDVCGPADSSGTETQQDMPLDIEQPGELIAYLEETGRITKGEAVTAQPLAGGVSNRTLLVQRPNGEAWVLKQALEKLRVAADWYSSPERVHREAAGLRWLARLVPEDHLPSFVFEDHEHHLLAMAAVPEPHVTWKTLLLSGEVRAEHVRQFGQLLGTIHRRAYRRRTELARAFDDLTFFETLRLEPYYAYAAEHVRDAAGFLHRLVAETRRRRLTLVHGDYSPKNILIYQERLILLDHEVIHFGDPAFDLGFSMTHLLSKAHHLRAWRDAFAGAAGLYWQAYLAAVGDVPWREGLEARAVRHTLGCLLARVAGRSPLEYLGAAERSRQRRVVVALMHRPPTRIPDLIDQFTAAL